MDSSYWSRLPASPPSGLTPAAQSTGLGFSFTNVAPEGGPDGPHGLRRKDTNTYLLETTGTGVAALDYDGDGWIDIFLVNGTTLEGFPKGQEPTNHLYRNRGNGTFEDVTARAGLAASGWGQGACVGDYDNDGRDDLFVTYWGQNRLYRNQGNGTFEDVTRARRCRRATACRWSSGCAFLDYDRDGRLDLFAANYIDLDLSATPLPSSGLCRYKGLPVACGPAGTARRQERALPQSRRRHVRRCVGDVGHHARERHLRSRRRHARLRR